MDLHGIFCCFISEEPFVLLLNKRGVLYEAILPRPIAFTIRPMEDHQEGTWKLYPLKKDNTLFPANFPKAVRFLESIHPDLTLPFLDVSQAKDTLKRRGISLYCCAFTPQCESLTQLKWLLEEK